MRCGECHIQFLWGVKYKKEKNYDKDRTSGLEEYCKRDEDEIKKTIMRLGKSTPRSQGWLETKGEIDLFYEVKLKGDDYVEYQIFLKAFFFDLEARLKES